MDLSINVAGFKEVPGPLGGATIEYEINVSTNIPELTRNSNGESINAVFVVWKTFREIEDFLTKVCRKFPKNILCNIGTEHKLQSEDTEERRIFADKFFANLVDMHHQCLPMLQEFFDCEHQQTCFNEKTSTVNNSPSKDNFDIFEEVREVVQLPDNKPVKDSSSGNLLVKDNMREEEADIFSTSEQNAAVTTPSFESSSMLSPTDSPFFFTPSTYKESDLFEAKPDQEMTEIKNPMRHSSTLGSPGDFQSAYDEIQLLSVDDDISELMEALQRKQDRPSNTKPKPAPKPLDLTGSGRPVPLPRKSLQSKSTPDGPDTSVEALADAFNTSDILNYIEKEENKQDAAEPQLF